jgi:hypothetical protein
MEGKNPKELIPDNVNLRESELRNTHKNNQTFSRFEAYYEIEALYKDIQEKSKTK